jgi:hypothetical protein
MLYQTPIGPHDGDSWERLCQVCLKSKYNGNYIEVPASPGDYGLDGFTLQGDAYQCYCPERECSDDDLYNSQRDKVTRDIQKLNKYKNELTQLLNGVKLKRWYLLTPKVRTNDIIFHCNSKVAEVKSWNLPFIDTDFNIVALNYEYLANEIPIAYSILDYTKQPGELSKRIELNGVNISSEEIAKYKSDLNNTEQTQNAFRKHLARYPKNDGKDYSDRVLGQVDRTVSNLLVGDSILKEWETLFQDQLDKFLKVIDTIENNVEDLCSIPTDNPAERLKAIETLVKSTIDKEFASLSEVTRMKLSSRVISDWILRCPLNFE